MLGRARLDSALRRAGLGRRAAGGWQSGLGPCTSAAGQGRGWEGGSGSGGQRRRWAHPAPPLLAFGLFGPFFGYADDDDALDDLDRRFADLDGIFMDFFHQGQRAWADGRAGGAGAQVKDYVDKDGARVRECLYPDGSTTKEVSDQQGRRVKETFDKDGTRLGVTSTWSSSWSGSWGSGKASASSSTASPGSEPSGGKGSGPTRPTQQTTPTGPGLIAQDPFYAHTLGPVDRSSVLDLAAVGDAAGIRALGKDVAEAHPLGWQAVHVAAVHGHAEALRALVELGADASAPDAFGKPTDAGNPATSPRQALQQRQRAFGVGLPHTYSYRGTTPLHYAVLSRAGEAVEALLELGADPTKTNESGHSALDLARVSRQEDLVAVLEKAAAKQKDERKRREAEERRKYPLRVRLRERLVGQEAAIDAVASAVRRKENGWYDEEHPLVLLFLGSSGVGKTELAKQTAAYLHRDQPDAFIRIDMSEFQQKHEVAKFIGSPPGYVGHEEGGQLTRKLRERPDAVVLFDEVEKAHPDILTILLQLFDEGRLTDGQGHTVHCKDAIFVMTSNIGSAEIADRAASLRQAKAQTEVLTEEFKKTVLQPLLRRALRRDEFIGRINELVYFLPFSEAELGALVRAELGLWKERAWARHRMELVWDEAVVGLLAQGFDPRYGARSIKHQVETKVVNVMASAHEDDLLRPDSTVRLRLGEQGAVHLDISHGTSHKSLVDKLANIPKKLANKLSST